MQNMEKLALVSEELAKGKPIDAVCKGFDITENELVAWHDRYAPPLNWGDLLNDSSLPNAVFPIFHTDNNHTHGSPRQVGSGVLVEIGDEIFALTAAHVTDYSKDGILYMPAKDGIVPITGDLVYNPIPSDSKRSEDKADMAYFRLTKDWRNKLHPSIGLLDIDDLQMTDYLRTGDFFTFVGYPWRKTKYSAEWVEANHSTYTGDILPSDVYERLGYSRSVHILIRINIKKTYSWRNQAHQAAPNPEGISGGGVLSWPWTLEERQNSPKLKLAGIAHTFHSKDHCMVATRVLPYIMAIVRDNPHLAKHFIDYKDLSKDFSELIAEKMATLNPNNVPSAIGVGWYKPQNYKRCLAIFDDGVDLPDRFDTWLSQAEQTEMQLQKQGLRVFRIDIDPETFPAWCAEYGLTRIDGAARVKYANIRAEQILREQNI